MVVISSSFSAPAEGIIMQQPSIKLFVNDQELGTGDLYITENNVVWGGGTLAAGGAAPTISLAYPTISLHAIQREPTPALFMVVNYDLRVPGLPSFANTQTDEDDEDFDPEEGCSITELRFMPQSEGDLQPLYAAMNEGQSLHPDPQDEVDDSHFMDGEEDDEGDEEFEDAEESNAHSEDAASRLRNLRLENSNGTHHEDTEEDAEIGE